jgi:hypothetical protein
MEDDRIARMEHFAFETQLSLEDLCARIRNEFGLPEFQFDHENETQWGWSELDRIEYNISRPYDARTLRRWDSTVPAGCNVGITLIVAKDHPRCHDLAWIQELVRTVGERLGRALTAIHHHRTWLAVPPR